MNVQVRKPSDLAKRFQWRDKTGRFHDINKMGTGHLFNTVLMIWNHNMPEEARTQGYTRYRFTPFYTEHYMRSAVKAMIPELVNRTDLTNAQKSQLNKMAAYLSKEPLTEIKELT